MSKNKMCLSQFGDNCLIRYPAEPIDCSQLDCFDELEKDCWELVRKYCDHFGFEILSRDDNDKNPISFDVAKGIQELILKEFKYAGIKFNFSEKE